MPKIKRDIKNPKEQFGDVLREFRGNAKISQEKLAKAISAVKFVRQGLSSSGENYEISVRVSQGYISQLEANKRNPSSHTISLIITGLESLGLELASSEVERLYASAGIIQPNEDDNLQLENQKIEFNKIGKKLFAKIKHPYDRLVFLAEMEGRLSSFEYYYKSASIEDHMKYIGSRILERLKPYKSKAECIKVLRYSFGYMEDAFNIAMRDHRLIEEHFDTLDLLKDVHGDILDDMEGAAEKLKDFVPPTFEPGFVKRVEELLNKSFASFSPSAPVKDSRKLVIDPEIDEK